MAELGKGREHGGEFKANGPVPELGEDRIDQETVVEQGDRETGGCVGVNKSAEEGEQVVAGRRRGDSGLWGEDSRGRGPKKAG